MSIVNTSTQSIARSITGFQRPEGVSFAPGGAYAYVANGGNSTVSIVNTTTGGIVGTVKGFDGPEGVSISPSGKYAYVTNENVVNVNSTAGLGVVVFIVGTAE